MAMALPISLRDLTLAFERDGSANPYQDLPQSEADRLRLEILERDRYMCQFCGMRSKKYLTLVSLTSSSRAPSNLVSACIFCAQCFEPLETSKRQSGIVIALPEIDQRTLHFVARDIYVTRRIQIEITPFALKMLNTLKSRTKVVEETFGTSSFDGLAKHYREDASFARKIEIARNELRLLPLDKRIIEEEDFRYDQFPQILAFWRSINGPYRAPHATYDVRWLEYAFHVVDTTSQE